MAMHETKVDPSFHTHIDQPQPAQPREIERLLELQQERLYELDQGIAYLTNRLYSVLNQAAPKAPCDPQKVEESPRTELGSAIKNTNGQLEKMNEQVNYLIRNCELP